MTEDTAAPPGPAAADLPTRAAADYLRTIQALADDGVEVIQARIATLLADSAELAPRQEENPAWTVR